MPMSLEDSLQTLADKFRGLRVEEVHNGDPVKTVATISDFATLLEDAADEIKRLKKKAGEV